MANETKPPNAAVRAVVDYGGLAAFTIWFFVAWFAVKQTPEQALLTATWGLIAGSAFGLLVGVAAERRIAPLPLFTGLIAVVFGALALIFKKSWIVQLKPTIIYLVLAAVMFVGAARNKNPLRALLSHAFPMTQAGWRKLTFRYGLFFFGLAALNLVVWRLLPKTIWVLFHFPGALILSVLFALTQVPMMMKEMKAAEGAAEAEP